MRQLSIDLEGAAIIRVKARLHDESFRQKLGQNLWRKVCSKKTLSKLFHLHHQSFVQSFYSKVPFGGKFKDKQNGWIRRMHGSVCLNVVHNGFMGRRLRRSRTWLQWGGHSICFNTLVKELTDEDLQEYNNYICTWPWVKIRLICWAWKSKTHQFPTHVPLFTYTLIQKMFWSPSKVLGK